MFVNIGKKIDSQWYQKLKTLKWEKMNFNRQWKPKLAKQLKLTNLFSINCIETKNLAARRHSQTQNIGFNNRFCECYLICTDEIMKNLA